MRPALLTRMSMRPNAALVSVGEAADVGPARDVRLHDERAPAALFDLLLQCL